MVLGVLQIYKPHSETAAEESEDRKLDGKTTVLGLLQTDWKCWAETSAASPGLTK
jgi:hypothetical protein